MSSYESVYDLACKCDWEGGITGMLYGYGLAVDDLPAGTPTAIVDDVRVALGAAPAIRRIGAWLDDALQAGDPLEDE